MTVAKLTSSGRITIPVRVQNGLGIKTGDRLAFIEVAPDRYEVVALNLPVTALRGIVPKPPRPVSVAAMHAVVRGRH